MYYEFIKKKDKKSGLTAASLYITAYKDGKRERTYLSIEQAIAAIPAYVLQRRKTVLRKFCRKVFEKGRRGRPPKITHHDKSLLEAAGFHVHKNEIRRDLKLFFTSDAAAMRFALLDEGMLLEYERKSLSLMKASAARGKSLGFKEAFETLISQASGCNGKPTGTG
ncbi:MAG: hypothetical protein NT118_15140 [Lentisphaerae bacterium]|nr:hypothetical protein [Lentisphaerota bacterium]